MRSNGILMHISSLPSPYGIGSMGKPARKFMDFLKKAGQSWWQILPICPTSYGDSPYQSFSTFAGNPYFIDLELLTEEGLLERDDYEDIVWGERETEVDYGLLYEKRYPVLWKAAERFLEKPSKEYDDFCRENENWIRDYGLFMSLKDEHNGKSWVEWKKEYRDFNSTSVEKYRMEHQAEIEKWKVLQFFFFVQWKELHAYANQQGIKIIGDLPIYVSLDSVDVWSHPEMFQLNEENMPVEVAGCPPDGFSEDGQLWGNPLFDWDRMEQDGFAWWVERIRYQCAVYDMLRIDHFRGFDTYFAIPYGDKNAKRGVWKQGPGMKLFKAVEEKIGKRQIIAEDLGFLTDSVRKLLKDSGFPGMKVMELGLDSRDGVSSDYVPHNFITNCVAYTGTHDNDTILGWFETASKEDAEYAMDYLCLDQRSELHWGMMKSLWRSVAELTVVQAQDILGLGSEARMNIPSTLGGNWVWRAKEGDFSDELAKKLAHYMQLYGR